MALSFRRNGDATYTVTLSPNDRRLLEQLVPQMRELIEQSDSLTWRLFPNAYPDDEKAAAEYREMVGAELEKKHLDALDTLLGSLEESRLDEDQLVSWMHAVNHLRLVIGTRLEVTEETEMEDFVGEAEQALFMTYDYLAYMLTEIVRAVEVE